MPTLRRATVDDAALIAQHRHRMFADNHFTSEPRLDAMEAAFEPWVRAALADGTYIGLFLADDADPQTILAAAGIYLMPFPPHWTHDEPLRAYLLNFYTAPEARGRGLAKQLVQACIDESKAQGASVITLHASQYGRPIYEKFGFTPTTEMMLRLTTTPAPDDLPSTR
jgi:GNAT superfamily N-acetyltransferase